MKFEGRAILSGLLMTGLAACGNVEGANLVFGQQQTVGLTIAGSTTDQGAELTLGYKDRNIAVVPVAVKQPDGAFTAVESRVGPNPDTDSMSVLGQFELEAEAGTGASVGLGKFFATGLAAQKLADGFAAKLGGGWPPE
jgi:hypothetical protein